MKKFNKNKKGDFFIEGAVIFFSYIILFLLLIIFAMLFSCTKNNNEKNITTQEVYSNFMITNYLRTPVDNNNNIADLITEYCQSNNDIAKIKVYLSSAELLKSTTSTARIVCPGQKTFDLRKPICKQPNSIYIPGFDTLIAFEYCSEIDNAETAVHPSVVQTINSPDGKVWLKQNILGINYYQERGNSENLLTLDKYNQKYSGYSMTQEYKQKQEQFKKEVLSGKSPITAPNGRTFKKTGDKSWCVIDSKIDVMPSCEKNQVSTDVLIQTLGEINVVK